MGCLKWSGSLLVLVLLASLMIASVTAWIVEFGIGDGCVGATPCCVFTGDDAGGALVRTGSCSEVSGVLGLSGKGIKSVPANAFEGMVLVDFIDLSNNQLGPLPGTVFAGLNMLSGLYLDNNQLQCAPLSAEAREKIDFYEGPERLCCAPGYGWPDSGGACIACAAGKYKDAALGFIDEACTDCGEGKYGVATGQTTEASCAPCGAGKYRAETGGSAEASCTACTPNSTSPSGSRARANCTCNAGYGGDAGTGTCTPLTSSDFDKDGVSDNEDKDDDNDGIPDAYDEDDDNDGIPDNQDPDDDNDGVSDAVEAPQPWTKSFGGCTFSGDMAGAPLVRTGSCTGCSSDSGSCWLDLSNKGITSVPPVAFQGMTQMTDLSLGDNMLSNLSTGVFDGLSSLQGLALNSNLLSALPAGIFAGLSSLRWIYLHSNQFSALPADIFAGLSNLDHLDLSNNRLTTLASGIFAGLTGLYRLNLDNNQLSVLPADIFAGCCTRLDVLHLSNNKLSILPAGIFAGLSKWVMPYLDGNQMQCTFAGPYLVGMRCPCNAGSSGPDFTCTACVAGKYKVLTGSAPCRDCGAGKYGFATGQPTEASCTDCGTGKYGVATGQTAEASCTACGAGKYSAGGDDMCITFVAAETSECCAAVDELGDEVKRLKKLGEFLGSEVERLKQLVTPRSSFIPTGNRTLSAWGNSGYSRCKLPFSWTELNKGYKEREILFRTGGLGRHMKENVYESWVCMDHFCGDPVFCWVYHEIDNVFTPWGPNSELLLITGL